MCLSSRCFCVSFVRAPGRLEQLMHIWCGELRPLEILCEEAAFFCFQDRFVPFLRFALVRMCRFNLNVTSLRLFIWYWFETLSKVLIIIYTISFQLIRNGLLSLSCHCYHVEKNMKTYNIHQKLLLLKVICIRRKFFTFVSFFQNVCKLISSHLTKTLNWKDWKYLQATCLTREVLNTD